VPANTALIVAGAITLPELRRLADAAFGQWSGTRPAAVALGQVPAAIGTQTNGSLIRPAAYCGVVAFKPTLDALPFQGVNVFSPTLDTLGVLARSVADCALLASCLADPGGICVSGAVRDQVGDRLDDVAFEDLGNQTVKNITRPIHVFRVRLEPEAAETPMSGKDAAATPITTRKPSIAVLPLVNMSGDPEQEFFADGLTEDIITELSRFRDDVRSFFRGEEGSIERFADRLLEAAE